jgi:hypothetical protein
MKTTGGIPKFERPSVFVLLIFWGIALLCWVPILIYDAKHPNTSGELDLGGAGLTAITLFVSGVFVLCGIVAVTHAFISFIWRRWRWGKAHPLEKPFKHVFLSVASHSPAHIAASATR